ncbi:MAG TPA: hypothetical protein VNS79_03905 [Sphingobium sp.]|nr:hypothetical protein [Sphingobium sp.]
MSMRNARFWGRVEMLVMAAACGTILGTGLLVGIISVQRCDTAIAGDIGPGLSPATMLPEDMSRPDGHGHYRARVIVNGASLDMIGDIDAIDHVMAIPDARRGFHTAAPGTDGTVSVPVQVHAPIWQRGAAPEVAGRR